MMFVLFLLAGGAVAVFCLWLLLKLFGLGEFVEVPVRFAFRSAGSAALLLLALIVVSMLIRGCRVA